ncbi:MAG: DHH family phosphoesterase [Clostridia bacterium]
MVEERDYADIIIDEEQALDYTDENTLLILVDVNRPSICESSRLVEIIKNVAVIDHHRTSVENVGKAVVSYVEPYASSASEMVTEVLQYLTERIKLKPVEADGLFAGIALDTKNFTIKTGVRTFEAAAFLRRNGADSIRVRKMFKNDMEEYKAKAQIVASAKIVYDTMAIAEWVSGMDNANAVAAQAADELLDIAGIRASFVLTKTPEQVNISARSLGDINVQLIMEKLSGGGHLTVAGAQLKGVSLEEATAKLREAIEEFTRGSDRE